MSPVTGFIRSANTGATGGLGAPTGTAPQADRQSRGLSSSRPSIFVADVGPNYNIHLVHELAVFKPDDPGNITTVLSNPLGELLDFANPEGLWQHYYYALEVYVHQQLLRSPLRVHTHDQADIIFLPIYLGVAQKLAVQYQHKETILLLEGFWDVYRQSSAFQSSKPHWIALADIELLYKAGCGGWGIDMLCAKEKQLPAALIISSPEIFLGANPKQPLDFTRAFKGSASSATTVAVPYFGHVHLSRGSMRLQQSFNATEVTTAKRYLAMQSFNDKTAFRMQLRDECLASNSWQSDCQHIGPSSESRTSFAYNGIQQASGESWFCIQPSGDTPTRAATFDCLMAGAIPVFFDPLIIELLPFGDKIPWRDIVVVEPEYNRAETTLEALTKIPLDARLKRLRLLHNAQTILQYSINPDHRQIQFRTRHEQTPQDDAFTSSLKAVLQNICSRHLLNLSRCK
ncbi:hypothetical protein WJX74_006996 [Apatococcus lobatus]|uniref:Exostosin GT47 domain-containing protein n=1 Tax=Apatococcus lobatus TaxID=904363 RepID=A0AAW1QLP4_9CHLO